jgi:imidazolonepropionase-like amidohydrolase
LYTLRYVLQTVCAFFGGVSLPAAAASLLLANAHVIDPAVQQEYVGYILIQDARIVDVWKTRPADFQGEEIDLTGKYLIPGLVDAHVHSEGNRAPIGEPDEDFGPEETARRMLYAGVTAYLDLGLDADTIFNAREKQQEGSLQGADIYAAGPVFIGIGRPGNHGGALVAVTVGEARSALDELATRRPDVIKLIFDWARGRRTMSAEVMRMLIEHARELGLKTVVHIGTWENARLAAEAGPRAITHLDDNAPIPPSVAEFMAAKRIFSIPTMAVQQDFLNILEDHRILDSALLRGVASESVIESYRKLDPVTYADCPTCQWQREGRKYYGVSLHRLLSAGVRIVAGSDTGNLGTFQGFSLHRELYVLNQWGLSRWDALAAGTTHAYELLGLNMGFKAGADATFVVLDASPLADIGNTQRIDRILFHGKWVDRDPLKATQH